MSNKGGVGKYLPYIIAAIVIFCLYSLSSSSSSIVMMNQNKTDEKDNTGTSSTDTANTGTGSTPPTPTSTPYVPINYPEIDEPVVDSPVIEEPPAPTGEVAKKGAIDCGENSECGTEEYCMCSTGEMHSSWCPGKGKQCRPKAWLRHSDPKPAPPPPPPVATNAESDPECAWITSDADLKNDKNTKTYTFNKFCCSGTCNCGGRRTAVCAKCSNGKYYRTAAFDLYNNTYANLNSSGSTENKSKFVHDFARMANEKEMRSGAPCNVASAYELSEASKWGNFGLG
jgi:hypothetical protein